MTPDLTEATVFYTVYGDEAARQESALALESAKGLLRSHVGRATGVKTTPTLTFVHDRLPDDARYLDELINTARERDQHLAVVREGAKPAGEEDPYRRPRTADDPDRDIGAVDDVDSPDGSGYPDGTGYPDGSGYGDGDGETRHAPFETGDGAA